MPRLAAVAVTAAALMTPAAPARAQAGTSVSVDRTGTAAGEEIVVTGAGWPEGTRVVVELCGREGRGGSVDCDVVNQRIAGVGRDGAFQTSLTVGRPPAPCPCVVRAVDQRSPLTAWATIAVQGLPTVPIDIDPPEPRLRVSAVRMSGGAWPELFGWPPERILRFRVENTGGVPLRDVPLRVTIGRGTDPSGVVDTRPIALLQPGEARTVELPVELDPLSFGRYTVKVEARSIGERPAARASTTSYPWLLVLVPIVLVQAVLLGLRNRARRRIVGPSEAEGQAIPPAPDGGGTPEAGATLDLDTGVYAAVDEAVSVVIAEHRRAVADVLDRVRREAHAEAGELRREATRLRETAIDALGRVRERCDSIVSAATDRAGEIIDGAARGGSGVDPHEEVLCAAVAALDEVAEAVAAATRELEQRVTSVEADAAGLSTRGVAIEASMIATADLEFATLLGISSAHALDEPDEVDIR